MVEVTATARPSWPGGERNSRSLRNYRSKVAMLRQALADLPLDVALAQVERHLRIYLKDGALGPADAAAIEKSGNELGRIAHEIVRNL